MRWITASQLEAWARSIGSRTALSGVISDLIRATTDDINSIRFPSGDKGQVRGFDGHLVSATERLNVPAGASIWEISTEENYRGKAQDDFDKRTNETPEDQQRTTTLVLATARTWDSSDPKNKLEDWAAAHRTTSAWKDVRVLDSAALQDWLEYCPAAAAWHASNTLKVWPVEGVRSTDEFWREFSGQFGPTLTEEVLLCDRAAEAQKVLEGLLQARNVVYCIADAQDEAVAFAVAAIRKAKPEVRLYLEARTIIVDSATAGRHLFGSQALVLLLRNDATRSPAVFAETGTTYVPLGRALPPNQAAVTLTRPTGHAMARALMSMGLAENESLTLARGCGRSLTALARLKPGGAPVEPSWIVDGTSLLPALLAGAWDSSNSHDQEIVKQLADADTFASVEARVRQHLNSADPPFDLEGTVWKVRAPLDAFVRTGILISKENAERLRLVAISVFGMVEEEPDPQDIFASAKAASARHSSWLREGLATTLLLIAVWSEPGRVNMGGESGQTFVNRILRDLPGLTSDYRLLTSLKQELPLLAEAAPDPLLSALEHLLEGNGELIAPIFVEKKGFAFPTAEHTGVLWALETLAWDPEFFDRAVLTLARLAAIDPGGKLSNRPALSLAAIFLPWFPQTNASAAQRLNALATIAKSTPDVGWNLLTKLLPTLYGTTAPTAKPRLREAGAADRPPVTVDDLAAMHTHIFELALGLAAVSADRWTTLIAALGVVGDADRTRAIQALDHALSLLADEERVLLWDKLRREVSRHETFSTANWALDASALAPIKALVERYAPSDAVKRIAWVFETWTFDSDANLDAANARRAETLLRLYGAGGEADVLKLGTQSKHQHLVVEAIANAHLPENVVKSLLDKSFAVSPSSEFTWGLSVLHRQLAGAGASAQWLRDAIATHSLSPDLIASFLLSWPDDLSTWRELASFGADVTASYWKQRPPRAVKDSKKALYRSLLMLLRFGRASTALASSGLLLARVPARLLLQMLDRLVSEINSGSVKPDTMLAYHIEQALAELDKRSRISLDQIARREYALLPLLEYGSRKLRIYELMASSAEFYFQILSAVYRKKSDPKTDVDDETKGRAQLGYSLLSHFDRLPGHIDKDVDAQVMEKWIDDLRRLGVDEDRTDVADNALGKVLARAPADNVDGQWPHRVVRDQIERLASPAIDDSIHGERLNMRGATTRGIYDGGAQERAIAASYSQAAAAAAKWPRTAALLRAICKSWESWARDADVRAAQSKLRS